MKRIAMISNKTRENRRGRLPKMSKNIERLYREGKCSDCSVVVTPMDFAKILGKFTKVKIQYESGSPKNKKGSQQITSPNARLKNNENGMVLIHRNAYNQHPANLLKTSKGSDKSSSRATNIKDKKVNESLSPRVNNILKENNRLKKTPVPKKANNLRQNEKSSFKKYGVIFLTPENKITENIIGNLSLKNLLPSIDKNILPSDDWCIDYLPKDGEPKEDKVYDRIAAELEDLMNSEKPGEKSELKLDSGENKDDFPSIMDILNDNTIASNQSTNQNTPVVHTHLESSDVEAMLLGKTSDTCQETGPTPMEVDNSVISNLMNVVPMRTDQEDVTKLESCSDIMDNPNSPSILDETLQKGIEAHLPMDTSSHEISSIVDSPATDSKEPKVDVKNNVSNVHKNFDNANEVKNGPVTHVVFKKCINGVCTKSVTCPKNLKYSIELEGKTVEFLGAPKYIASEEDLKVLLQIVNETELSSLYVWH